MVNTLPCCSYDDIIEISEVFKVFADPTRLRLILALAKSPMNVNDIAETLQMTQSAVSHQLRVLRSYRLVKWQKAGKTVIYEPDDEHIYTIIQSVYDHIKE